MYEELIKKLRNRRVCIQSGGSLTEDFPLMQGAADAIEELQKVANKLLAKYQEEAETVIWEYSTHIDESIDYLHEEIRGLQAQIDGKQELPKEETE